MAAKAAGNAAGHKKNDDFHDPENGRTGSPSKESGDSVENRMS